MIICGELQNTLKVGVGSFEHVQNTFKGDGVSNGRGVNPLISGVGSPPGGTFCRLYIVR